MAVEIAQFTCHGRQNFFKVQVKQGSDGWDPVKRGKGKSKLTTKTWGYQERKVNERSCAACVWTRCPRRFEMEENGGMGSGGGGGGGVVRGRDEDRGIGRVVACLLIARRVVFSVFSFLARLSK